MVSEDSKVTEWLGSQNVDGPSILRSIREYFEGLPKCARPPAFTPELALLVRESAAAKQVNITSLDMLRTIFMVPSLYEHMLKCAPEVRGLHVPDTGEQFGESDTSSGSTRAFSTTPWVDSRDRDVRWQVARLADDARITIENAGGLAVGYQHTEIGLTHLLVAMLKEGGLVKCWLDFKEVGVEAIIDRARGRLEGMPKGSGSPHLGYDIVLLLREATIDAELGVTSFDLLRTMFRTEALYDRMLEIAPELRRVSA